MNQEKTANPAGRNFAGEVGFVDLVPDEISPLLSERFELLGVGPDGQLRRLIAARAGKLRSQNLRSGAGREG